MKKTVLTISFIILIMAASIATTSVHALTNNSKNSTSSAAANSQSAIDQKILNEVASHVAKLKLVEKRGIIGTVTNSSSTQITLSDLNGNIRFVDVDELTRFSSPSAKSSFGISDIKKGQTLGVLGLYNKDSQRILARFVNVISIPKIVHGAISAIDNKNYTITVSTKDGSTVKVNVETVTRTFSYTKNTDLIRSGFSKIKMNEHVIVIGFPDIQNQKLLIASRIILFPDIPKDPTIPQEALAPQTNVTPSTGSGKKLTPITK